MSSTERPLPADPTKHPFMLAVYALALLILAGYGLDTALHAQSWAGQLGGGVGVAGALLLLLLLWRRKVAGSMFFFPYLLMKSWVHLDAGAAGTLTGADFILPALLSLGTVALVSWAVWQRRRPDFT